MRNANQRDAMIRRHLPLARHCARRYHRGRESLEDLEQVASLALVRAADSFDPARGRPGGSGGAEAYRVMHVDSLKLASDRRRRPDPERSRRVG